ncbi:hypothetical protein NEOKW01_2005 [Nematocida sp. AWRm80]|nr:hypothetical protein NEOKW01_2005 [Nematocida sp. AWRm80]
MKQAPVSPEERKTILKRMFHALRQSPMFSTYSVEHIRDSAIKSEQLTFDKSFTRNEYMQAMQAKLIKIEKSYTMNSEDILREMNNKMHGGQKRVQVGVEPQEQEMDQSVSLQSKYLGQNKKLAGQEFVPLGTNIATNGMVSLSFMPDTNTGRMARGYSQNTSQSTNYLGDQPHSMLNTYQINRAATMSMDSMHSEGYRKGNTNGVHDIPGRQTGSGYIHDSPAWNNMPAEGLFHNGGLPLSSQNGSNGIDGHMSSTSMASGAGLKGVGVLGIPNTQRQLEPNQTTDSSMYGSTATETNSMPKKYMGSFAGPSGIGPNETHISVSNSHNSIHGGINSAIDSFGDAKPSNGLISQPINKSMTLNSTAGNVSGFGSFNNIFDSTGSEISRGTSPNMQGYPTMQPLTDIKSTRITSSIPISEISLHRTGAIGSTNTATKQNTTRTFGISDRIGKDSMQMHTSNIAANGARMGTGSNSSSIESIMGSSTGHLSGSSKGPGQPSNRRPTNESMVVGRGLVSGVNIGAQPLSISVPAQYSESAHNSETKMGYSIYDNTMHNYTQTQPQTRPLKPFSAPNRQMSERIEENTAGSSQSNSWSKKKVSQQETQKDAYLEAMQKEMQNMQQVLETHAELLPRWANQRKAFLELKETLQTQATNNSSEKDLEMIRGIFQQMKKQVIQLSAEIKQGQSLTTTKRLERISNAFKQKKSHTPDYCFTASEELLLGP